MMSHVIVVSMFLFFVDYVLIHYNYLKAAHLSNGPRASINILL
jgi:hypothetical protein